MGLAVLGLSIASCDADSQWEQGQQEQIVALESATRSLQNQANATAEEIASLKAQLDVTIAQLQADIATNAANITANAEVIVTEVEAITNALNALAQTDADLTEQLAQVEGALISLTESFENEVSVLRQDIIIGLGELEYDFNVVVADLRDEIAAAQDAAEAYADANDAVGSFNSAPVYQAIQVVQDQVDALPEFSDLMDRYQDALAAIDSHAETTDGELTILLNQLEARLQTYADGVDTDTHADLSGIEADIIALEDAAAALLADQAAEDSFIALQGLLISNPALDVEVVGGVIEVGGGTFSIELTEDGIFQVTTSGGAVDFDTIEDTLSGVLRVTTALQRADVSLTENRSDTQRLIIFAIDGFSEVITLGSAGNFRVQSFNTDSGRYVRFIDEDFDSLTGFADAEAALRAFYGGTEVADVDAYLADAHDNLGSYAQIFTVEGSDLFVAIGGGGNIRIHNAVTGDRNVAGQDFASVEDAIAWIRG